MERKIYEKKFKGLTTKNLPNIQNSTENFDKEFESRFYIKNSSPYSKDSNNSVIPRARGRHSIINFLEERFTLNKSKYEEIKFEF